MLNNQQETLITRKQLSNLNDYTIKKKLIMLLKNIIAGEKYHKIHNYSWHNALLLDAIRLSHEKYKTVKDLEIMEHYINSWIKIGFPIYYIDQLANGPSLIYLHQITEKKEYKEAVDKMYKYIINYHSNGGGAIPYREKNKNVFLIDTLGMVCPFLSYYGHLYNEDHAFDLASDIIIDFIENAKDINNGLFYHGYNNADKIRLGISGWGRGMGWLILGLVGTLQYLPKKHKHYETIEGSLKETINVVIKYQKDDGSFSWHLPSGSGYSDSSATGMIGLGLEIGMKNNLLSLQYEKNTDKILKSIKAESKDGTIMGSSPECLGVGCYPNAQGNFKWAQGPSTSFLVLKDFEGEVN